MARKRGAPPERPKRRPVEGRPMGAAPPRPSARPPRCMSPVRRRSRPKLQVRRRGPPVALGGGPGGPDPGPVRRGPCCWRTPCVPTPLPGAAPPTSGRGQVTRRPSTAPSPPSIPGGRPGAGASPSPLHSAQGEPLTFTQIYERVRPSCVSVLSFGAASYNTGSGVIFTEDGYVLTNAHVVAGGPGGPGGRCPTTAPSAPALVWLRRGRGTWPC